MKKLNLSIILSLAVATLSTACWDGTTSRANLKTQVSSAEARANSTEVMLSWCGLCNFRPFFTSAIEAVDLLSIKSNALHYAAVGTYESNRDPSGFPAGFKERNQIEADITTFSNFPSAKLSSPNIKRFSLFVINHGGNPEKLSPGTPGIFAMLAGKHEYIKDEEIRNFGRSIPASIELRTVSEACWGANTAKVLLEARVDGARGCYAALADMNWGGFVVPESSKSWSRSVAEGLENGSLFDAALEAGSVTSLGKFESQREGDFSNAGLTGSEWIVLEYFRDLYSLRGTSLDLQAAAKLKIKERGAVDNSDKVVNTLNKLSVSIQKRSQFARRLEADHASVTLPADIVSLQDISTAKKILDAELLKRIRAENESFVRDFPEAATADIMMQNNPDSTDIQQHFGPVAATFKKEIAIHNEKIKVISKQRTDLDTMDGQYSYLGKYHRKLYARMLDLRNSLETYFVETAPPELVSKFFAQRACELKN
ncbi:MAG: hypothetical protein NTV34_12340 [Proteobacteria bacterium]|nr:hypothetical protein [Pseudomonadota bacterium]